MESLERLKELTEKLSKAEDLIEAFFDLSLDLFCIVGTDGFLKNINRRAWTSVLGYTEEELLASEYIQFIHPDDWEKTAQAAREMESGDIKSFHNRFKRKEGGYVWISWKVSRDKARDSVYSVGRVLTTDQELVERLGNAQSELFFKLSPLLCCITSADGYVKRANISWLKETGFTPEELMAKPYLEFIHEDDRLETSQAAERMHFNDITLYNRCLCKGEEKRYIWLSWTAPKYIGGLTFAIARVVTSEAELARMSELSSQRSTNSP